MEQNKAVYTTTEGAVIKKVIQAIGQDQLRKNRP